LTQPLTADAEMTCELVDSSREQEQIITDWHDLHIEVEASKVFVDTHRAMLDSATAAKIDRRYLLFIKKYEKIARL
jgi:hypothetical protein